MKTLRFDDVPSSPISAAGRFYADHLPIISSHLASTKGDLAVILPAARPKHDHWRRAAARDLAREHAPARVNIIGGGDADEVEQSVRFLKDTHGITGQYIALS